MSEQQTKPLERRRNIRDILIKYPPSTHNLLYPGTSDMFIDDIFEIVAEEVSINPDPDYQEVFALTSSYKAGQEKSGKDIWKSKLALANTALKKLAHAAGIAVDHQQTRQIPTDRPTLIKWQAHCGMQKADGSPIVTTQSKTIDLDANREKQLAKLNKDAAEGKIKVYDGRSSVALKANTPECNREIERRMQEFMIKERQDAAQKAETGAINRCIRVLLALKPWYREEDLTKPFVVIKIVLNTTAALALADASTRTMFIREALRSKSALFGQPQLNEYSEERVRQLTEGKAVVIPDQPEPEEPEEQEERPKDVSQRVEVSEKEEQKQSPSPEDIERENREAWERTPREKRVEEINRLVKATDYKAKDERLNHPEKLDDKRQVDFLMHLTKLYQEQNKPIVF